MIALWFTVKFFQNALFGPLRSSEIESLTSRTWYTVVEFGVALIVVRQGGTIGFFLQLLLLLSLKWFHWLSGVRIETPTVSISSQRSEDKWKSKLVTALVLLHITDLLWVKLYFRQIMVDPNILSIILAFEGAILYNSLIVMTANFTLDMIEGTDSSSSQRALLRRCRTYITTALGLVRLGLYLAFSCTLLTYYCIPLHIFRESYLSLRVSITKVRHLIWRKNASRSIESYNQTCKEDEICIICRETTASGQLERIIKCGHIMHAACLYDWLAQSSTCPTCRETI